MVEARRHLSSLSALVPGHERRRHRRSARHHAPASTIWPGLASTRSGFHPIYPSPMADFGYDITDYCDIDPVFGTLQDFDALLARRTQRRHEGHSRPRSQPHLRPASLVSRKPQLAAQSRSATGISGAIRRRRRPAQQLDVAILAAAPGSSTARPASTTTTPSSSNSPISTGAIRMCARAMLCRDALLARARRRRFPHRCAVASDEGRASFATIRAIPTLRPAARRINQLLPLHSADRPEMQRSGRARCEAWSMHSTIALLIGEIYLPLERLVAYYGGDLRGRASALQFPRFSAHPGMPRRLPSWSMNTKAALPPGGGPIGCSAITISSGLPAASAATKPASRRCSC